MCSAGLLWNHLRDGVHDQTDDHPLAEHVRWLRHAEGLVGLSGGLSWLAWAPISGRVRRPNEFTTPYRAINWHVCSGRWNDERHRLDRQDYLWCQRHAGLPRQFERTRLITATQSTTTLKQTPGLIERTGIIGPRPVAKTPRGRKS